MSRFDTLREAFYMFHMTRRDTNENGIRLMLRVIQLAQTDGGRPVAVCVKLQAGPSLETVASYKMFGTNDKMLAAAARKCDVAFAFNHDTILLQDTDLDAWDSQKAREIWLALEPYNNKGGGVTFDDPDSQEGIGVLGVEGRTSWQNHDLAVQAAKALGLYLDN